MQTRLRFVATVLLAAVLVGCATTKRDQESNVAPITNATYSGTIVKVFNAGEDKGCPVTGTNAMPNPVKVTLPKQPTTPKETLFLPLIAAVLPALLDKGFDYLAEQAKKRKEELTTTYSAATHYRWEPTSSPVIGCLVVAKGDFDGGASSPVFEPGTNPVWGVTRLNQLGLARPPKFYFEAWIYFADPDTNKHIALAPRAFEFREQSAERVNSSPPAKDLLLTVKLQSASTKDATSGGQIPAPRGPQESGSGSDLNPQMPGPATKGAATKGAAAMKGGSQATPASNAQPAPTANTQPKAPQQAAPDANAGSKDGQSTRPAPSDTTAIPSLPDRTTVTAADNALSFALPFPNTKVGTRLNSKVLELMPTEAGAFDKNASIGLMNIEVGVLETEKAGDLLLSAMTFVGDNKDKISPQVLTLLKKLLGIKDDDKS